METAEKPFAIIHEQKSISVKWRKNEDEPSE